MDELYQLPDGWEWKRFDDIAFIKGGKRVPKGKKLTEQKTAYPYIRVSDFRDDGTIDTSKIQYITEDIYHTIKNYTITCKDLYISIAGTIGKTGIVPKELNGSNLTENAVKLVYKLPDIENTYVYFFTLSSFFKEQAGLATKIVAMPKLAITRLAEIKIPLPPQQEQQRIVAKLDALFEKINKAIALHVKNMEEADGFMASVLNEVFSELEEKYEKITFDKVCKKITDGSHNPPQGIENSEYIMLSSKNIFNGLINFDNPRYLSEKDFNIENKRTDIEMGDVLLTIVGTIGRTAVVDFIKKFTLQRSVAVLKPNRDILNSYFLMYSLQKNLDVLVNGAQGAAQKGIYLNSVKKLEIVNAPISLQQKIVTYLDDISFKIEHVKKVQKEKMESLKALKASILDSAFRGEL